MTRDQIEATLKQFGRYGQEDERRKDAVIEEQARCIKELEEWRKIVIGTGTDQEAVIRMAATEYTKVAVQCWKQKCEQQAQQIARLENGLGCSRSHPHEDMNQICELRTEVARLNNELSQRTNLEGSAPCWNSAHMKQIATLREALQLLYDVQNGCPLPKYQADWDLAIALTQQALKEVSP